VTYLTIYDELLLNVDFKVIYITLTNSVPLFAYIKKTVYLYLLILLFHYLHVTSIK
jgi:hypothetical protein